VKQLKSSILFCLAVVVLFMPLYVDAAKTAKIKLTGTAKENILMTIGNTGRTEVISSFPYVFEVPKDQMPVRLSFVSDNYVYYSINVPKKPIDTTGHVYLVKIDEDAMAMRQIRPVDDNAPTQELQKKPITGIDLTKGVNAAPVTGRKSEKTFALIIANENYELAAKVDHAINDGLAFKEYCLKTLGLPDKNVRYCSDLSFGKMRKALNDILDVAELLNGEATLLIYYAGHGIPDNKTKDAFLMPIDAEGTDTEVCISLEGFYSKLNSVPLKRCIVFLDACFSGAQRGGEMIVAARGVKLKPQPAKPKGNVVVLSATSGDEAAFSYKEEQHGLFTYFLLKKLQESKGKASLGEISDYITKNVGIQSRLLNNMPQTPTVNVAPGVSDNWRSFKLTSE